MKKVRVIGLLLFVVFLAGCFSPSINIVFKSDPLLIEQGQTHLELDLIIKLSGFSAKEFVIKSLDISIEDEEGEVVLEKHVSLNQTLPGVINYEKSITEKISLGDLADLSPEEYEQIKGKEYNLKLFLEATKPTTADATILFQ